jgi:hypothetical protein
MTFDGPAPAGRFCSTAAFPQHDLVDQRGYGLGLRQVTVMRRGSGGRRRQQVLVAVNDDGLLEAEEAYDTNGNHAFTPP